MLGTAQQQTIAYSKPPPLRPVRVRRVRKANKESAPKPAAPPNITEEQVPQLVIDVPAQREEVGRGCKCQVTRFIQSYILFQVEIRCI